MANDGGPAFPVHPEIEIDPGDYYGGMRLRDYFAAAALIGLVSTPESHGGDARGRERLRHAGCGICS